MINHRYWPENDGSWLDCIPIHKIVRTGSPKVYSVYICENVGDKLVWSLNTLLILGISQHMCFLSFPQEILGTGLNNVGLYSCNKIFRTLSLRNLDTGLNMTGVVYMSPIKFLSPAVKFHVDGIFFKQQSKPQTLNHLQHCIFHWIFSPLRLPRYEQQVSGA